MLAAERFGGVAEAVEISGSPHRLRPVSATFHGRDLFAPVAAHLAAGAPLADAGEPLEPDELVRARAAGAPRVEDGARRRARDRDRPLRQRHARRRARPARRERPAARPRRRRRRSSGEEHDAHFARTFADVEPGELLLYEDAYRMLALAVNRGSAAERLAVALDDELRIRPR